MAFGVERQHDTVAPEALERTVAVRSHEYRMLAEL
jgi:hypothetical protein